MRKKILTKESVLDTAEKIIVSEGMSSCSMRRISGELGVAVGTIYNYYESREELLMDLFTISWTRTIEKAKVMVDAKKSRWQQLTDIISMIQVDVKNRNGLGREIFIYSNHQHQIKESTVNLRQMLSLLFEEILNQRPGLETSNKILSKWMIIIFVDALIEGRKVSQAEMDMIRQLTEVPFDL